MDNARKHDVLRIPTPKGTRDSYREVARLVGMSPQRWAREALRRAALEVLEEHGVTLALPPVHPPRPKRLQPRIQVRPPADKGEA
ncbi:MAG: hypothetical protein AB7P00_10960 [Sandaracinaceae bacterium]